MAGLRLSKAMGVTPPQRHWRSYGTETALAAIEAAHASEVAALRERADAVEVSRVTAQAMAWALCSLRRGRRSNGCEPISAGPRKSRNVPWRVPRN